jgi:glycerate kinase
MSPSALACPASLKGVLSARDAAAALVEGLGEGAVALPVADGGEGTLDVLHAALGGEWRQADVVDAFGRPRRARWLALPDGTAAVEAAEAVPLDPGRLDALAASSRGLGELIRAVGAPARLLVGLGGVAVTDGGAGLREVLGGLPAPTEVLCDVRVPLLDAARLFAPQKGASPGQVQELVRRLSSMEELAPYAELPGAGAAGGLGAALAALGARLEPGAERLLDLVRLRELLVGAALVVTGEGTVDRTTAVGKAPGAVARIAAGAGVRCVVFGGRVVEPVDGAETIALSGDPLAARSDLVALGRSLRELLYPALGRV